MTDVASHCCLQPTRTRWGRVIYPKRSLHGRLWPSMTQCTILEFNSIFGHLVALFHPVRLPACFYFAVKYQLLNACWTALFIQAAPVPPPTIIMCSLATTCSFRSMAGLDHFFTCREAFRGGEIPSSAELHGHDSNFRHRGLLRCRAERQERSSPTYLFFASSTQAR